MNTQNLNVIFSGTSYTGFAFAALPLGAALLAAAQQVDKEADAARRAVVPDTLRAFEHDLAAAEARAFVAAGYVGDMPPFVKAWADAAELGPQAAADSIVAEADAWNGALLAIRAARLKGKQRVLKAASHDAAEALADEAISAIRASIEGVGNAA